MTDEEAASHATESDSPAAAATTRGDPIERLWHVIKANPGKSLLAAAAVGALIGLDGVGAALVGGAVVALVVRQTGPELRASLARRARAALHRATAHDLRKSMLAGGRTLIERAGARMRRRPEAPEATDVVNPREPSTVPA